MSAPIQISVRADVKRLQQSLDRLANTQVPYATALALTAVAKRVQEAEAKALSATFKNPVPFTQRAFRVRPARKSNLTAIVFALPIQAAYLEPSEDGVPQALGKGKRIRTPVDIGVNASGDIPKGTIKRLAGRKDVFVGEVKGVNGVWQRLPSKGKRRGNAKQGQRLRLLIAFTRPKQVKTRLNYRQRAQAVIATSFDGEFSVAMKRALATVKV
jgi:hypothetical protein